VSSSALEVMVAREEGPSGGRVCDDEGSRRGVEVVEFSVEGGRTRFARRKEKNAGRGISWSSHGSIASTKGYDSEDTKISYGTRNGKYLIP
jgi:hypothetical protein